MTPDAGWPYPLWIAHRGAGKLAPENTMAAFRLGASFGWRAFECDVKLSADGIPFLLHDATLDRTAGGRGSALLAWAELAVLDAGAWHGPAHAGEPLPRLDELAAWLIAHDLRLNLEIKPIPGQEALTGQVIAHQVQQLWAGHVPPLLSSFQPLALRAARQAAPELPRALLLDALPEGWLQTAKSLDAVAVVMQHRLLKPPVRDALRQAGLKALCYTVNDPDEVDRLLALDVDGIITDVVDRFGPAEVRAG